MPPFNNIINSFKNNIIATNFSTIFLQTVEIENSYWFALGSPLTLLFDLPIITHYINNLLKKKKRFVTLAFLLVKIIKKSIDLKSKTKYISPEN